MEISPELTDVWPDSWRRKPRLPSEVQIPQSTKAFLARFGLPVRSPARITKGFGMSFADDDQLFRIITAERQPPHQSIEYYVVGQVYEQHLGVRRGGGEVYVLDGNGSLQLIEIFANTLLEHFFCFVAHLAVGFEAQVKTIEQLEAELMCIDSQAFEKSRYWWPTMLSMAADGMW